MMKMQSLQSLVGIRSDGEIVGFGAEQVILVRDDRVKSEVSGYIGRQALVLTISECKGLEFKVSFLSLMKISFLLI